MLEKCEGIVVRKSDYGESDKIITIFSREYGKFAVMAKGAKKSNSRLSAVSQLFTHAHFLFRKGTGMGTLQQGDLVASQRRIKEDLFKSAFATYMVELLDKGLDDRKVDPYLFELLAQSLSFINEGYDEEVVCFIFEMKMLPVYGVQPVLDRCAHCGETEGHFSFSIRENGLLCHRCSGMDPYRLAISKQTVRLLRIFYFIDLNRLGSISLQEGTKKELRQVIRTYYDEYVGVFIKSRAFLEQLDRMKTVLRDDSKDGENKDT
ncbi:DNA repair protein RecO [Jeotgalibacillus proteolyticus]|uniref:DNA repair protein RecO n=1 Tax=Jeotgalibacillus proteolyticus TaxID=2082395 RepID=A0A2S5GEV8_9BACL|nr:DNA repair protein RecO [Jeotgalibacillus proteolyticus]PPA71444.1 DNA repair protein RecO [Jeotgalibacillus proteolyticus]